MTKGPPLRRLLGTWCVLALSLGVPGDLMGQGVRAVGLTVENDGLAVWTPPSRRSDWYYTHGGRLELVGSWTPPASGLLGLEDLPACADPLGESPCRTSRFAVTQRIFTPKGLFSYSPYHPPSESDRPYAGWLSFTMAVERVSPKRSRRYAVEVGVTGDPSFARQVHLAVHEWFDKARPSGWEHQIPFEVAGAVSFRETWRLGTTSWANGPSAVLEPTVAATVGTLRASADAGVALHLSWNARPERYWAGDGRALLSVRMGAEVVGRDLFLDGSTWHDSARTERKDVVMESGVGLLLGWRDVNLTMGATRTTPTFVLQQKDHIVGTVGLAVRL